MKKIRLGRSAVPGTAKELLMEVWKSGQFSPGEKVREFEVAWARLHGAKHSVFLNSGTDALRCSLLALKEKFRWKDGDKVVVPATTFVATVNVVIQAGLEPFFVDVGMIDYLINPWNLERRWPGENVVAIIPVHLFGNRCSEEVYRLAKDRDMAVLEDSCETILNKLRGDVSCHSTYMAHHVTTGVGGFASTNSDELNLLIRSYANHGRNVDYLPGYAKGTDISKRFRFDRIGYSARGTEFEAALGLAQLPTLAKDIQRRRDIACDLAHSLSELDRFIDTPAFTEDHTFMMMPLVLRESSRVKKYDLCNFLEKNGIETRDFMPIVTQPCYKQYFTCPEDYTVSWALAERGFYIPCHPGMTEEDVSHIRLTFKKFFANLTK